MTEQNLTKLTINTLTKSQYQALYNSGDISYTEIYLITDDNGTGVYALANNVYTKAEIDDIIANLPSGGGSDSGTGVDLSNYYTKDEITALLANKANTSDLSDYVEIADLANVATSGDYNDLSNTPTIPSKTSDLTNDSGYVSSSSLSTVATSGSYNDLSNKPDLTVYETKAEAFSGDYDDLTNKPDLSVYQTVANSFSGDYDDLSNKPDLTVYQTIANSFSGDYDDLSNKPDLSAYQTIANAFSGSYNDLTDKPTIPTIPTNISSFTNDSGYQTASNVNTAIATALTGYATESYVQTAVQGLGNVFTIKGSVSTVANLPSTNNSIGDVYYVAEKQAGYIWIEIDNVAQWEQLGETIDLSNYVQTSDLTWNNISSKPTIPDAVSGTNDGTNWTSLTIGSSTFGLASGSAPSNMVTTNTAQTISGSKTFTNTVTFSGSNSNVGRFVFTGRNPIKMTAPSDSTTGFSLYNSNNYEKGYLQYIDRQDALYLGRWSGSSSPKYAQNIGFLSELGSNGYRVLMPNKTSTGAPSETANTYYIPTEITNGTTVVKASSDGIIDISSLLSGTGGSGTGGGTTVSGTNDGTNWTSITIGNVTKNIPSGSGSAPSNMVTTDTAQEITGSKVFKGSYKITCQSTANEGASVAFKASSQSSSQLPIGVMEIDEGLKVMKFSVNGVVGPDYVPALGYFGGSSNYNYVAKLPKGSDKYNSIRSGNVYLPLSVNKTKADSSGNISLNIPSVSGTNDGSNWTSLTIGNTTYNIPSGGSSGGSSADAVTLTGDQNITGVKTFVGKQKLKFKQTGSNDTLGFTAYNNNNYEIGNLQVANRAIGGSTYPYVTLGNFSTQNEKAKVGFRVQPNNSQNSYNFVVPYGTNNDFINSGYATNVDTTIPCAFTDGTTTIKANATGLVNLSTLNLGGSGSGSGTSVSGTNDGTNWTSLTINGSTYNIPAGASSSSGSGIVDINDIPLVEGELVVKKVQLFDEQTGEPLYDENGDPIYEERLGIGDVIWNEFTGIYDEFNERLDTLEQNSGGNVPTKTSDLINDSGFITSASVPSSATSTSTSTVTPSTIQLTFTFEDDTTQTVTLMTGATVSTTTTTTLS